MEARIGMRVEVTGNVGRDARMNNSEYEIVGHIGSSVICGEPPQLIVMLRDVLISAYIKNETHAGVHESFQF